MHWAGEVASVGEVYKDTSFGVDKGAEVSRLDLEMKVLDGTVHEIHAWGKFADEIGRLVSEKHSKLILHLCFVKADGSLSISLHKDKGIVPRIEVMTEEQGEALEHSVRFVSDGKELDIGSYEEKDNQKLEEITVKDFEKFLQFMKMMKKNEK